MSELSFMVVDDHMLMRVTLVQYLRKLGYSEVDTAINGEDALGKIETKLLVGAPYDIVFVDLHMPVMDGMELLRICRNNPKLANTAFVMLTGECEKQKVIEAMQAGITSYIVKPISQNILASKLENILKWVNEKRSVNHG